MIYLIFKQFEESSKVTIDSESLLKIIEEYSENIKEEAIIVEKEKINLTIEDKVRKMMVIIKILLSGLNKSDGELPTNTTAMKKKISTAIKHCKDSNIISFEYITDKIKNQIKSWIFKLLQEKDIIDSDENKTNSFEINQDKIDEYLTFIEYDIEGCIEDVLKFIQE